MYLNNNTDGTIAEKSKSFAVRIINLYKYLTNTKNEYIMSKQILRSGTSIGANVSEAQYAYSKNDFYSKLSIAIKETAETRYWLDLLVETDYITYREYENINNDCLEILKILTAIMKSRE